MLGPGLLVAATGIGAGDLATASFTGSILGTAVYDSYDWAGTCILLSVISALVLDLVGHRHHPDSTLAGLRSGNAP